MDFLNETLFNAGFVVSGLAEDRQLGCVIARPVYEIQDGELVLLPDETWPVGEGPFESEWGTFPPDTPFLNGGLDVLLVGSAYPTEGPGGTYSWVQLEVGPAFKRTILVMGDRVWVREPWEGGSLVPSEPAPFESIPLTWDRAYGGKTETEHGELAFGANPEGRGFYLDEEAAEGGPLPNLEHPDERISGPRDQPKPWCAAPYPMDGSLRPLNAARFSEDGTEMVGLTPLQFNVAHPDFIIPAPQAPTPGTPVRATGVSPGGELAFALPRGTLAAEVSLEGRRSRFPLHLDQLLIQGEKRRVMLSYRVVFTYRLVPRERRTVTLVADEPTADP